MTADSLRFAEIGWLRQVRAGVTTLLLVPVTAAAIAVTVLLGSLVFGSSPESIVLIVVALTLVGMFLGVTGVCRATAREPGGRPTRGGRWQAFMTRLCSAVAVPLLLSSAAAMLGFETWSYVATNLAVVAFCGAGVGTMLVLRGMAYRDDRRSLGRATSAAAWLIGLAGALAVTFGVLQTTVVPRTAPRIPIALVVFPTAATPGSTITALPGHLPTALAIDVARLLVLTVVGASAMATGLLIAYRRLFGRALAESGARTIPAVGAAGVPETRGGASRRQAVLLSALVAAGLVLSWSAGEGVIKTLNRIPNTAASYDAFGNRLRWTMGALVLTQGIAMTVTWRVDHRALRRAHRLAAAALIAGIFLWWAPASVLMTGVLTVTVAFYVLAALMAVLELWRTSRDIVPLCSSAGAALFSGLVCMSCLCVYEKFTCLAWAKAMD